MAQVSDVIERTSAHGAAVSGAAATLHALDSAEVRRLLLTEEFMAAHSAETERAIGWALDSDAEMEIVTGAPAVQLGRVAGGIAAQLRYVVEPITRPALVGAGR